MNMKSTKLPGMGRRTSVLMLLLLMIGSFVPRRAFAALPGTTLSRGDVAIVAFSGVTGERFFAFVCWKDLAPNTEIDFTTNSFLSASSANATNNTVATTSIGTWVNTTGATIAAGTVIEIQATGTTLTYCNLGTASYVLSSCACGAVGQYVNLTTNGRGFFIFQGTSPYYGSSNNPATFNGTILYGMSFQGTSGSTGSNTFITSGTASTFKSYLPSELAASSSYYMEGLGTQMNWGYYNGSRSSQSNMADYQALVTNPANWVKNTTTTTPTFSVDFTTFSAGTPLSATTSQTNVACNGGSTGTASVTPAGGTAPYSYSWMGTSSSSATATGLAAGSYTCTITDAASSSIAKTFNITQPPAIASNVYTQTNVACFGGNTGSATINTSGGTGAFTYAWSPSGGSAVTATGLAAGVYTCTITDANSCTKKQVVTITQPVLLSASVYSQTNVACFGASTGSAIIIPSGGTGSGTYSYSWSAGGSYTGTLSSQPAGAYTCTVTDANSCTKNVTVTLTQPPLLSASLSAQTNIACNGGNTGSAAVTVSGGTGSGTYSYAWTGSSSTGATVSALSAGTYTCTVTDANSCTKTVVANLTQPTVISLGISSQTNVACNGGNNGAATISATGGVGSYAYSWAPSGGSSATATGLTAGTYTCSVTDANSCTKTQTVTITQPGSSSITASVTAQTNVACNGGNTGSATITATGSGSLSYSWSPSGGSGATGTGFSAGVYTCTITDVSSGCSLAKTATITQPAAITATISAQTNVACNGGNTGSATVTASGGTPTYAIAPGTYTYSWAPSGGSAATATGLTAGTYTCTVTDANSCTKTVVATITQPLAITSSVYTQTNVACNGGNTGAATITVSGGTPSYTYSWSGSSSTSATATGLSAGTYTCTITDANSCSKTQVVTITQPTLLTASISAQTNVACNGANTGSLTVLASGGANGFGSVPTSYTYAWSGSSSTSATATGLGAGTYTCTVTDLNSCTTTATGTITQPLAISTSVSSQTNVACNGNNTGAATIGASGGTPSYSYAWSGSSSTSATATGLTAGTYTCVVTDANSCTKSQTVTISQPTAITATISAQTNVACNGGSTGSATVSASGGTPGYGTLPTTYTYSWSPSGGTSATATGLAAGTYTCVVTDANSCSKAVTVTITQPGGMTTYVYTQTNVACNGNNTGAATISVSGGTPSYSYAWSSTGSTSATATGLAAGTYTCIVTDANSCTKAQTVTITQPTALTASISAQTNVLCNGNSTGAATVLASGGTTGYGTAPVSYTYAWSPSGGASATATGLAAGTYTCTITDLNSCTTRVSATITQPPVLTSSLTATSSVTCYGGNNGTATISAAGGTTPYNYSWSPVGGTGATGTGLSQGTYTCVVTDGNGCTSSQMATILQPTQVTVGDIFNNSPICSGNTLIFSSIASGGTGSIGYSWSGPSGFSATGSSPSIDNATTSASGTYTLTATDANGCTATATSTATVNPLPANIGGSQNVCIGQQITLTDGTSGGSWSSSNTSIAPVDASGIVNGANLGSATISYTLTTGCYRTLSVSVNPYPSAITGLTAMCLGNTVTLSSTPSGGSWSTSNTSVATVDNNGVVTSGPTPGSVVITYTSNKGCAVNTSELNTIGDITGTNSMCTGMTSTLASLTTGGMWSSSNTALGTVNPTLGVVNALTGGNLTITYTVGSCYRTQDITISTSPAPISGPNSVCVGSTITMADASTGGTWGSSSVGTIGGPVDDGRLYGVMAGTAIISYSLSNSCYVTKQISINPVPVMSTGTLQVCPYASATLANTTGGGSWSSSNTGIAFIDASSGTYTGVSSGTATISYTLSTGCARASVVTINAAPANIAGTLTLCAGTTTTLTDATTGVSWSSSTPSVATINASTGIVTGVGGGTSTITYTIGSGCIALAVVTVNSTAAITGTGAVCPGATLALGNATGGGVWSTSATVLSVNSSTGEVTGNSAGTGVVTYTANGCAKTTTVTVNANPAAITGSTMVLSGGGTVTLSSSPAGGVWTSSNTTAATIGSTTGVVTGGSVGSTNVSYTVNATGCSVGTVVTVSSAPPGISGTMTVCAGGGTTTLSNSLSGGTWSTSNNAIATATAISSNSAVITSSTSPGTVTVTYTLSSSVKTTSVVTINSLPSLIGGATTACVGVTTTLNNSYLAGVWTSSNPAVGTIAAGTTASTGIFSPLSAGSTNITYTFTATGCARSTTIAVYNAPNPGTISGPTTIHLSVSPTVALTSTGDAGGTWTSNSTTRVQVNASTGVATGMAAGSATITYAVTNTGCTLKSTQVITVSATRPGNNLAGTTASGMVLYPNPNSGLFTISGNWAASGSEQVTMQITDMLGHEVYSGTTLTREGAIDQKVQLPSGIASGMYLLHLHTESDQQTIRFTVGQ